MVFFPAGVLQRLICTGAFALAPDDVRASNLLKLPRDVRWEAAGGSVHADRTGLSTLGDEQRRLWFETFVPDALDDDEVYENDPDLIDPSIAMRTTWKEWDAPDMDGFGSHNADTFIAGVVLLMHRFFA